MILLTMVVTGFAGCSSDDDEYLSTAAMKYSKELLKGISQLPLPIAQRFLYMDAVSSGPGTTVYVGKSEGRVIYRLYSPFMSSLYGIPYDQYGIRAAGVKDQGTDWQTIVESSLMEPWEEMYPGGYQLFKLRRYYHQTVSNTSFWDGNKSMQELPEWLSFKIDSYRSRGDIAIFFLYQGEWRGMTVYYFDVPDNVPFSTVQNADGANIQWDSNADLLDFLQSSRRWQLVYVMSRQDHVGTEGDYDHRNAALIQPIEKTPEWKAFFDTEVRHPYWDGEGNMHRTFFDQTEWNEEKLLVINSEQELKDAYTGDKQLPTIDFNQYTLLIGKDWAYDSSYQLNDIRLYDKGGQYVLDIDILHHVWGWAYSMIENLFYWKVYPKLQDKEFVLNRVFSFDYDK